MTLKVKRRVHDEITAELIRATELVVLFLKRKVREKEDKELVKELEEVVRKLRWLNGEGKP